MDPSRRMSPGCSFGPEFRFGEGRISGVSSLALGALSLLAVLCFRFPELLTTPDLRAVYPLPLLRAVLFGAMLLSLALALVSLVLSRRRALGLGGILFTGTAVALGGAWVEAEGPVQQTRYLGLDWFVLDLLVRALVFLPLERLFALRPAQRILRAGIGADLAHFPLPLGGGAGRSPWGVRGELRGGAPAMMIRSDLDPRRAPGRAGPARRGLARLALGLAAALTLAPTCAESPSSTAAPAFDYAMPDRFQLPTPRTSGARAGAAAR